MTQMPPIKMMALGNNYPIIIEGVNDIASICKKKNCNFKYNKCNKMHLDQINECLDVHSLTNNRERSKRLAHRMRYEFNLKKRVITIDNVNFNSSGILLFNGNYVYLFQNASIILTDPNRGYYYNGMTKGRVEETDLNLETTASREVYEESCKTLMIETQILNNVRSQNYVDNQDYGKNYRIYFCELPEDCPDILSIYTNNLEFISDTQENSCYHETNQMYIFDVNDIIAKIKNKEFSKLKPGSFKDINGDDRIIDRKTIQAIFKYHTESKSPIKLDQYDIIKEDLITTIKFRNND